jgi:hypothetical protein
LLQGLIPFSFVKYRFRGQKVVGVWYPCGNNYRRASRSNTIHNTTTRYRYYQQYPPSMLNQCSVHTEQTKLCLQVISSSV